MEPQNNLLLPTFTGLFDKTGKAIKSGDIGRFEKWETYTSPDREGVFTEKVFFAVDRAAFRLTGIWPELNKEIASNLEIMSNPSTWPGAKECYLTDPDCEACQ